jgi:PAS domain S-box-containing protein
VLRDSAGRAVQMFGVNFDVTERKRAAEQLSLIIEAAPTGMILSSKSGEIRLVNAEIERIFGYSRLELYGRSIEMLVPERFRLGHLGLRRGFNEQPSARAMGADRDLYGLCKDGSETPVEIGLNPLETFDGSFVLSSVVDISERKRAAEQLRLIIEAAPTGMILTDKSGEIRLVNAEIERVFGYSRTELYGRSIEMLVPERFRRGHLGLRRGFNDQPTARAMGADRDLYGLCKDGGETPVEIGLNPLETSDGSFVLSSVVDISERRLAVSQLQKLNAELNAQIIARTTELKEREAMLQEIHHRVKNNLQVISSLINMQVRSIGDIPIRLALQECRSRVETMAYIHEMLYQSKDYAHIPFAKFAADLVRKIMSASEVATPTVTLRLELDDLLLPVDKAIPCGLILNELVSNSLKHAFPNGGQGEIYVEFKRLPDRCILLGVSDDGVGMPATYDPQTATSLGVQLIFTLVEQLEARIEVVRLPGTKFRITFSEDIRQ